MKLTEFLDKVHEYMLLARQTDAICSRLLSQGDNNADALTESEKAVFEELNNAQRDIEQRLPLFRKGCNCANCKHFDVLYDTWDNNMQYPRCMYDGENEYTRIDGFCENFEPIEE
jgi:hypothetical protein